MRREEEIFRASRNSVSSNREVGKTLNSTGLVMYSETIRTITETVIFALIRISKRNDGNGAIITITMPSTARGTLRSLRFPNRSLDLAVVPAAPGWDLRGAWRSACAAPAPTAGAETGTI